MIYKKYGKYYDVMYHEKNYEAECEGLITYFQHFGNDNVTTILDAGCGTGNHSILLAEKGYQVTGIDISQTMITIARQKANARGLSLEFHVHDMRNFELERKFDAILCLFGSFGYCITDDEIASVLKNFHQHLVQDGLLILDFWPLHANMKQERATMASEVEQGDYKVIRIINRSFDLENDTVQLRIKCLVIKDNTVLDTFQEHHVLRTFSLTQMRHFLHENGFTVHGFFKVAWRSGNPYTLEKVDQRTPNVACVAKKR